MRDHNNPCQGRVFPAQRPVQGPVTGGSDRGYEGSKVMISVSVLVAVEVIAGLTWITVIVALAVFSNRSMATRALQPASTAAAQAVTSPAREVTESPTLPLPRVQQAIEASAVHYHVHFHGESSPVRAQTGEELP